MSRSAIKASRNAALAGVRKASSRNPARESASHLYVADKTMPMFATQSSYQADVSTPAAKRMLAKEAVVEAEYRRNAGGACSSKTGPVLRNRRYPESVHNKFMNSYQAAFGSKMAGLSARIKPRAAERRAAQEGVKERRNLSLVRMLITPRQTNAHRSERNINY